MAYNLLSEIDPSSKSWNICVLLSRLWHYRGGTDAGPIKHTDIVLLDKEGNHMYAQIPPEPAKLFKDVLQEGNVYALRKFLVIRSKPTFRPVEGPYMIQLTKFTIIEEKPSMESAFPFCTYRLTSFTDLPKPTSMPERFVDIIGYITAVSDIIPVQSMFHPEPSDTRMILLKDLTGNEMKLTLWGDRATEFDADQVLAVGQKEPIIAIFVGTLPKMNQRVKVLSGSSACRWYINEDIPDINSFRSNLGNAFSPITLYTPTGQMANSKQIIAEAQELTVGQLLGLNLFDNEKKNFACTVTITALSPGQRWWFPSCSTCHRTAIPSGTAYACSDPLCSSVDAEPTYCLCLIGTDGTGHAEFVLFDNVARAAIAKPLMTILQYYHPGQRTVQETVAAARLSTSVPTEIARVVAQKYRFIVSISTKSFSSNSEQPSFQVRRIDHTYRPQLHSSAFGASSGSPGPSSTSGSIAGAATCPPQLFVVPFSPQTPSSGEHMLPAASDSLSLHSAAHQAHGTTPTSILDRSNLMSLATSSRTVCPGRGARHSLFAAKPKEKEGSTNKDLLVQKTADALEEDVHEKTAAASDKSSPTHTDVPPGQIKTITKATPQDLETTKKRPAGERASSNSRKKDKQ